MSANLVTDDLEVHDVVNTVEKPSPKWVHDLFRNLSKDKNPTSRFIQLTTSSIDVDVHGRIAVFQGFLEKIPEP